MTRKRVVWIAASLAGLLFAAVLAGVLLLRSQWFYEQVRRRIVSTVETATGGRVEAGSFRFDWTRMRAEVREFVIHGSEPAGKPPLFRASSVAVGLKIVSVLKRSVDIQYLEVAQPRVYLIVYPDGRTNVPAPKIRSNDRRNAVETILDLAIGRFGISGGIFEVESHSRTPFDARGQDLNAKFVYDAAAPRYRGDIAIRPLEVHWPDFLPVPFAVNLAVTLEKNRIGIDSAKLSTGGSRLELSGAIVDLASPHGSFQYDVHAAVPDVARIFRLPELKRGTVDVGGNAVWPGAEAFTATGNVRAEGVEYSDSSVTLRDCRLDGALTANTAGIDVRSARITGNYVGRTARVPASGHIDLATLRGREVDLRGVSLAVLGGTFEGQAHLSDLKYYRVAGNVAGFDARRIVALYSPEALPWDALASGEIQLDGALGRKQDLRASANIAITPAPGSAPVHGQVSATYLARGEALDLGRSTVSLPSSRVDFFGALNREMRVHLETRDIDDLLPAIGQKAGSVPVKLVGGAAVFDGTVTGSLSAPQVAGRVSTGRFSYADTAFDTFQAAVTGGPDSLKVQNAVVTRGSLRAQGDVFLGPRDWKFDDSTAIGGAGVVHNADVQLLASLIGSPDLPVTGTANIKAQFAGTVGKPMVSGDVEVVKGSLRDEPFDRFTTQVNYSGRTIRLTAGHLTAGSKQVDVAGVYDHAPDHFDQGRLHLQISSNAMPLEQIQTLQQIRPGAKGTLQVNATGDFDLIAPSGSAPSVHVLHLNGEISARQLQLTGQALGDARITADSQGQVLHVRLESDFANSNIGGSGEWRLEGDYPGSATIKFPHLDFAQLRSWLFPSQTGEPDLFTGYAEGELNIQGPLLQPAAMKAELRIPKLEIGPPPGRLPGAPATYALHNDGPVVATLANNVVTIASARLKGRATDLTIGGRIQTEQKTIDAKLNGHIDLAVLHDFDADIASSGIVNADATVRGPLDSPQVNGRLQFQNATFSINDVPNGISKASGVILLSGNRGTIQSFTGETGGGKIELSGFASYNGDSLIFQLHARATEVRVRYPEGVSTVANADLNLTGTTARSMLSGTITVLRTGFNPQSDFGSILASSAQPVRTPSVRTGLLGGLNFEVQIHTAPDIQFSSSLTQDLQVDANLLLRGNFSNPALVGRITINQGQLVFYGTRYTINQGSIAFYNPVKIDPILDIDLETKARGIDVTLTVSGPLNKLTLTPRSDPPLQFQEIVALLATGRTPTSDPTLLTQQSTSPQSWQQMGASALLGQAIANPVAGRLQRFFGVSKLRIDPTLPGVENNPQARLTLEQQVTPDLLFTYITNVTTANPQVVRIEWSLSKQWSVVALREENGTFGLDFFFKRRF